MTLHDLAGVWAGHDLHHLRQLRAIGQAAGQQPATVVGERT